MSDSVLLTDDQPVDPDDELLVAYLDSELDDQRRKDVEKRLVDDADFRKRLQSLQSGWEWLDEFPNEFSNEKLVESTIELVVSDIVPDSTEQRSWMVRHQGSLAFAGILLCSTILGAIGLRTYKTIQLRNQLSELAIAENLEAYRLGANFKLFRELAYNPRWNTMVSMMERIRHRELTSAAVVQSIPLGERADVLQSLANETREKLVGRWEAYQGFSEETKSELRATAANIRAADDGAELLETMQAAAVWMEGLSDAIRDQLSSDDELVRRQAIEDAIDFTMEGLERESGKMISDETSEHLFVVLQLMLTERIESNPQMKAWINSRLAEDSDFDVDRFRYFTLIVLIDDREFRDRFRFNGRGRGRRTGFMSPPPSRPAPPQSTDASRPNGGPSESPRPDSPARPGGGRPAGPRPPEPSTRPSRGPSPMPRFSDDEILALQNVLSDEALADLETVTRITRELAGEVLGEAA